VPIFLGSWFDLLTLVFRNAINQNITVGYETIKIDKPRTATALQMFFTLKKYHCWFHFSRRISRLVPVPFAMDGVKYFILMP